MRLILFRHGEAEPAAPDGHDASRRLVAKGIAQNAAVARAIARTGLRPRLIIHSPLVRARETAEGIAPILEPKSGVVEDPRLACGARWKDVRDLAAECAAGKLVLVGHNPDFTEIAEALIGGGEVVLKTSGAACVNLEVVMPGGACLEWLLTPELVGDF